MEPRIDLRSQTTDEDPERVAVIQRLTWAYLANQFGPDVAWDRALRAFSELPTIGRVESK